jgi:hypothetical protein
MLSAVLYYELVVLSMAGRAETAHEVIAALSTAFRL